MKIAALCIFAPPHLKSLEWFFKRRLFERYFESFGEFIKAIKQFWKKYKK